MRFNPFFTDDDNDSIDPLDDAMEFRRQLSTDMGQSVIRVLEDNPSVAPLDLSGLDLLDEDLERLTPLPTVIDDGALLDDTRTDDIIPPVEVGTADDGMDEVTPLSVDMGTADDGMDEVTPLSVDMGTADDDMDEVTPLSVDMDDTPALGLGDISLEAPVSDIPSLPDAQLPEGTDLAAVELTELQEDPLDPPSMAVPPVGSGAGNLGSSREPERKDESRLLRDLIRNNTLVDMGGLRTARPTLRSGSGVG